ncbi:hypothetical protein C882_2389 [Caenispirillum salinarum AK4]|uniref:Chlorhexidine efflux transporter domain-containing protein n=1 Tax=Caenispirillum salinarum AK4 TaxID=1238182 RepID=K9HVP8_9PROT|nr:PACE efflux transporter [Caenispirillum salinarum]EKV32311.1 hypothetical protein C882_2389 [Caenispirillum salinarum AK4]
MRTTWDRIRQAVSFELIGLLAITPLASWLFGVGMGEVGALAVIAATIATAWNYIYNLGFDHLLRWRRGHTRKTLVLRVVHAIGFEGGLLLALLPLIAWWLGISLVDAFVMDVFFAAFYIVYAFVFTWAYDTIFPAPDFARQT